MNVGKKARGIAKRFIHFLTLGFTAFWLVATSKPAEPADDCFVALSKPRLTIALGASVPVSAAPSCAGLDGLVAGGTLDVALGRSKEPPDKDRGAADEAACWSYQPSDLRGVNGVSALAPFRTSGGLFELDARFVSSAEPAGCYGDYHLRLAPSAPLRASRQVDPLHPKSHEVWLLTRLIRMNQGQACGLVPPLPHGYCQDTFTVRSMGHAP
jgi:hypothetical protein